MEEEILMNLQTISQQLDYIIVFCLCLGVYIILRMLFSIFYNLFNVL